MHLKSDGYDFSTGSIPTHACMLVIFRCTASSRACSAVEKTVSVHGWGVGSAWEVNNCMVKYPSDLMHACKMGCMHACIFKSSGLNNLSYKQLIGRGNIGTRTTMPRMISSSSASTRPQSPTTLSALVSTGPRTRRGTSTTSTGFRPRDCRMTTGLLGGM